jgi:hypothetical protein
LAGASSRLRRTGILPVSNLLISNRKQAGRLSYH